jgi:hypothetical protein
MNIAPAYSLPNEQSGCLCAPTDDESSKPTQNNSAYRGDKVNFGIAEIKGRKNRVTQQHGKDKAKEAAYAPSDTFIQGLYSWS